MANQHQNQEHGLTSEEARQRGIGQGDKLKEGQDYVVEAGRGSSGHSAGGHPAKDPEVIEPMRQGDTNNDEISQLQGQDE
jgi:hypothetical protein